MIYFFNLSFSHKVAWLNLIRPDLFNTTPEAMTPANHVILLTKLTANQAEPSWPLLVQTLLCREMTVAKLILLHFGAFVPGKMGDEAPSLMTDGCRGFKCRRECIGAADLFWPQVVGSGVLRVGLEGSGDKDVLVRLMEPLVEKLGPESWEALNKGELYLLKNITNIKHKQSTALSLKKKGKKRFV